ncbi:MAG: TolC family protein [Bacteroidota bacterium]
MPSPSDSARAGRRFRPAITLALALAALVAAVPAPLRAQTGADSTAQFDHFANDSLPPPVAVGERWSLARCIAAALQQNGDVRVAQARSRQASGSALSAWNNILPSLTLGGSATRQWPPSNAVSYIVQGTDLIGGQLESRDETVLNATVQTNLISLPGWSEKRRRDRLGQSARQNEAETRNTVVFQVKQQYFSLLKAERLAEVARESERLARDEETRSEALFEVGTVARGDVLKARARRAQTELDRIKAYNQVRIQTARLKQVIGLPPEATISVDPILESGVVMPDSASSVRSALVHRPRLESAQTAERAARAGVFGAYSVRLPLLTGSFDAVRIKTTDKINRFDTGTEMKGVSTSDQRQAELRVSLPIFDGLAIEGNIRQAKGVLAEAEANRRQLELNVAVEVQQAWLTLREAVERIGVAREGRVSAEEDYNFSKSRYELGAGTFLDLLNAEVSLAQARQSEVEALADARVAEADLERAIGERRY